MIGWRSALTSCIILSEYWAKRMKKLVRSDPCCCIMLIRTGRLEVFTLSVSTIFFRASCPFCLEIRRAKQASICVEWFRELPNRKGSLYPPAVAHKKSLFLCSHLPVPFVCNTHQFSLSISSFLLHVHMLLSWNPWNVSTCSLLQRNSLNLNHISIIVIPYFCFSVLWVIKRIIVRNNAAVKKQCNLKTH